MTQQHHLLKDIQLVPGSNLTTSTKPSRTGSPLDSHLNSSTVTLMMESVQADKLTTKSDADPLFSAPLPSMDPFSHALQRLTLSYHTSILTEYNETKKHIQHQVASDYQTRLDRLQQDYSELEKEMRLKKQVVAKSEEELVKRDEIVDRLVSFLQRQQSKHLLHTSFMYWQQCYHHMKQQESIQRWIGLMADKNRLRRLFIGWKRTTRQSWKQRQQEYYKKEKKDACEALEKQYQDALDKKVKEIQYLENKLSQAEIMRSQQQEDMKQSFLRGVCALNMEAMNLFQQPVLPLVPSTLPPSHTQATTQAAPSSPSKKSTQPSSRLTTPVRVVRHI